MKDKIYTWLKTIMVFLLFFILPDIPMLFGIDVTKFSDTNYFIYRFIMSLGYILILIACYHETLTRDFKKLKSNISDNIDMAIKYWLPGFLVMIISNAIIIFIFGLGLSGNEESIRDIVAISPLYMFFSASLYAPFTEELIFRKSFRDVIKNPIIYVLSSGFIFGFLHVMGYVNVPIDWIHLIPYCSLGFAFALLYYKSDNIYLSMIMHFAHNTFALLLMFL